jgi:tetratricopeptide (TPR) repeat protein
MKLTILFSLIVAFLFSSCTGQEKKSAPPPLDENTKSALAQDSKAKALYEKVEQAYASGDKVQIIAAYLNFGNYMMFESSVPPRQKYRPALKAYNAVLALQPDNPEAAKNKKTIEDIYTQMGLPIPKD